MKSMRSSSGVYVLVIFLFAMGFAAFSQEAFAHHIVANVPVASSPMRMSIVDDSLYISHISDNIISVIDTRTDKVQKEIATSGGIISVEAVPDKNKIYAAVFESDGIDVYHMDTGLYDKTITLPDAEMTMWSKAGKPYGQREYVSFLTGGWDLAYNPNNELLYVTSYNGDVLRVIDTRVDQVAETIPVVDDPYTVRVDPMTDKVIIGSLAGNAVTFVTPSESGVGYSQDITHEISSELKTGISPWCLDIDSMNHLAFVSHRGSSTLSVINIIEEEEVATIQLPGRAQCVTVDETEQRVYVSLFTSNEIVKINGETFEIIDIIETTGNVWDLVVEPNSHKIYASHQGDDVIVVLSPQSVRETLPIITQETPVVVVDYILYHGQDVRMVNPILNVEGNSISSRIVTNDGGSLTVQIPHTVLVAQQDDGQDKEFSVTVDGKSVTYEEVMTTDEFRSINFFVPEESLTLEIIGTDILSEPQSTDTTTMMQDKEEEVAVEIEKTTQENTIIPADVICEDKTWIENNNGKIACVTPSTAQKLVERGWGTILE